MMQLRRVFIAPRFDGDRDDAASSMLNVLLWATIVGATTFEAFQLAVGLDTVRTGAVAIVLAFAFVSLAALRRRHLNFAAWGALSLIFGIACVSIWLAGRLDAPGATTFVVLVVMSAMALDWRSAAWWTLLAIAALSCFAVAEVQGWMPPVEARRPVVERWFIYSIHLAAAGWLVGHSAFAFRGTLGLLGQRSMALRDSEARNAQLIEQSPDVIVALDGAGIVTECSPAIETLFGYRVDEVVGRRFPELRVLDEKVLAENMATFRGLLSGDAPGLAETRVLHRDGSVRWVEANPRVVRQADGSLRVYLVIRDTTARHEAEEQRASLELELVEARRLEALGRMAGGVAHDFNNLLLVILANAELLESESDAASEKLLGEIRVAAEGAADLTGQLLAFSGRQVPEADRVDVAASVAKIDGLLRRLLPPNVELDVVCSAELDPAHADPTQLEQVVVNLVMNAQQAMSDGGRILVEMSNATVTDAECRAHAGSSPGPHVRLAVTDQGRGMNAETAQRIFEPFFSQREGGTGLGLATVHGIVTRAGGHIRVHSGLDEGTRFEVFLPVATGESLPLRTEATSSIPASDDAVVLLVDDEAAVLRAVARLLEEQGFQVLSADSPETALAISRSEPGRIHLLISDVLMPRLNGTQLARQLMGERPDLKVLLVSGFTPEDPVREDVLRAGVYFMPKPFSGRQLGDRIREILRHPGVLQKDP